MEKRVLIFYHKEDNDGVFSCAMIYDYLTRQLHIDNIDCVGLDYTIIKNYKRKDIKELREKYARIFLTDISFPVPMMEYMFKLWGENIVWIDHHAPVIEAVNRSKKIGGNLGGVRETNRSAILCAYKYLYDQFDLEYQDKTIPKLFRILSAWDSFTFEREGFTLDYVKAVNEGITHMFNLNLEDVIECFSERSIKYFDYSGRLESEAFETGSILNEQEKQVFEALLTNADCSWKVIDVNGVEHSACAISYLGKTNSTMFASVKDKVECGIVFKMNNNKTWTISLYNTSNDNDFHCGKFLREKYKGGGHQGAAGCQVRNGKFINMLRKKQI